MSNSRKKTIWLSDQMVDMYENPDGRTFSRRVADTIERYNVLMGLAEKIELTERDLAILGEAVLGTFIDRNKIRYLPDSIRDTEMPGAEDLANKVESLDYLGRMALVEKIAMK